MTQARLDECIESPSVHVSLNEQSRDIAPGLLITAFILILSLTAKLIAWFSGGFGRRSG